MSDFPVFKLSDSVKNIAPESQPAQRNPEGVIPSWNPITNNSSTDTIDSEESQAAVTPHPVILRYTLQAAARELLPDRRVAWCMRRFAYNREVVEIRHRHESQSAYYYGLMRCSRLWECPVCAAKISETRRKELDDLIEAAKEAAPLVDKNGATFIAKLPRYFITMLTFTMQHSLEESCEETLERLAKAYRRFWSGRKAQALKKNFYIVGYLRALEITHGESGWHPHYHLLVFHDTYFHESINWSRLEEIDRLLESGAADEEQLRLEQTSLLLSPTQIAFHDTARRMWSDAAAFAGGYADPNHGVDLTVGGDKKYAIKVFGEAEISKWSLTAEVTKQPVKKGKAGSQSLTDLLIAYARGSDRAGELWVEAVKALHRQKHIQPSLGLWKLLGRGLSDEESASEELTSENDTILASLNWMEWMQVLKNDARGQVLAIAAAGNASDLWDYLESLGIYRGDDRNEN